MKIVAALLVAGVAGYVVKTSMSGGPRAATDAEAQARTSQATMTAVGVAALVGYGTYKVLG